jgi:hypothetical protein
MAVTADCIKSHNRNADLRLLSRPNVIEPQCLLDLSSVNIDMCQFDNRYVLVLVFEWNQGPIGIIVQDQLHGILQHECQSSQYCHSQ